jgi:hypothetical protein
MPEAGTCWPSTPPPGALRQAGRTRILRPLKARLPRLAAKVADEILQALDAQTVVVPAVATLGRVVAELAGELGRTYARRDRLAGEIEEVFTAHPFGRLLRTLPGNVPRTGGRSWPRLVTTAASRPATAAPPTPGLPLPKRQSGKLLNADAKSRRGNHRLKNAMFLAAFSSLRSPEFKAFYDRKRAEGKRHNTAVICLARRRCDVILAMLNTNQPFQAIRATGDVMQPAA